MLIIQPDGQKYGNMLNVELQRLTLQILKVVTARIPIIYEITSVMEGDGIIVIHVAGRSNDNSRRSFRNHKVQ